MNPNDRILSGHRLVVLAPDIPWPANRGGRADVWRRIQALRAQGAAVFLIHLFEPTGRLQPSAEDLDHIKRHVDGHDCFPMRRGRWLTLKRLANASRLPWHAATRVPLPEERARLIQQLQRFAPTAVWLEGPWFGELAGHIASTFGLPLAYRSHNVEFRYLRGQADAAARRRDQVAWRLACLGLERYELKLMQGAQAVFDISIDDMAYWRSRGVTGARWLPPLPEMALSPVSGAPVPGDIVFSGNLRTPNNLLGLQWLMDEVMPLVWRQAPEARLRVVGSAPSAELQARIDALPNVDASYDVPSVQPYVLGARALANPVFVGSGVQLKTLDMLSTDVPIVTRGQGLRGLPPELKSMLRVADSADAFAAALVAARSGPDVWAAQRHVFRQQFTSAGIACTVAEGLVITNKAGEPARP
jgi:polysaccharide biosynthesis protein PslH